MEVLNIKRAEGSIHKIAAKIMEPRVTMVGLTGIVTLMVIQL